MAKPKEVTTKFRADVSDFKKGFTEAVNQIKMSNAMFDKAVAGMDDWSKSSEGLSKKIEQLTFNLEAERKKLKSLEDQYEEVSNKESAAYKTKKQLEELIGREEKKLEELTKTHGEYSLEVSDAKDRIEDLRREHKLAETAYKANAREAEKLALSIEKQGTVVKKTEKEVNDYKSKLTQVNAANKKAESSFKKLEDTISNQEAELKDLKDEYTSLVLEEGKNSKEAKDLAKQMSELNKELDENQKKLSKAEGASKDFTSALKDADKAADNAEGGFSVLKGTLAELTADVIKSAVSSIGDLVTSFLELDEATKEYRQMQSKLEGSAKTFGYSVEFANEKYKEFYKYLGDDQMATNAVTNLMGLGTSTDSISKLAEGATAVWASYGDSIPIESLTEAINETIQVGKVTGTFADTINWANISNKEMAAMLGKNSKAQKAFNKAIKDGESQEDAFSAALAATNDEQERADIVANFLNTTYGESKKTYDEMTGSIQDANEAELELKDTQAEIGETLAPVNTAFTDLKNQALEAILPIVKDLAQAFLDFKKYLEEHPEVAKALTAAVIALGAAFGVLAGALAIQGIITGVTKAIAFLNTTLLANPIVLIVAAIAGLVAAFIYLWNNVDGFKEFWISVWENIKSTFNGVIEAIKNGINTAIKFFTDLGTKVANIFQSLWDRIVEIFSPIVSWFTELFTSVWKSIESILNVIVGLFKGSWKLIKAVWSVVAQWFNNTVVKPIKKIFEPIVSWFGNIFSKAWNSVKNAFSSVASFFGGVWNSIKNAFGSVTDWFRNTFSKAWTAVKNVFSKGGKIFDGIKDGIASTFKTVVNGIIGGINKVIKKPFDAINGMLNKIRDVDILGIQPFKGFWGYDPLSVPQIPMLAEGGLAKKNNPFLAILGDNPTQDEIISPINTMKQAMNEVLQDVIQKEKQILNNQLYNSNNNSKQIINNFYQTNNSPEPLNNLTIYRQTKNILSMSR